jgi:diguanylate cyclase (GGDEF)-like protein
MTTFKAKLVVYFLLLSLLPIAAVFWAFSSVASQSETQKVDVRLQAGMRAALAAYQEALDARGAVAERLAHDPSFQRALEHGQTAALRRAARGLHGVHVTSLYGKGAGPEPPLLSAKQVVNVSTASGLAGSVVAFLPFDRALTSQLHRSSGLDANDAVAILDGRRIVSSTPVLYGTASVKPGVAQSISIGGVRYRVVSSGAIGEPASVRLLVLSPQEAIDAATGAQRDKLLIYLALVLLAVGLVAFAQGRTIARTLGTVVEGARAIARGRLDQRVPAEGRDELADLGRAFNEMADQLQARLAELEAERGRLREAFARFGDALSATHDPSQLVRVVLDATVEATGASGAALIDERSGLTYVGDIDSPGERLELPLTAGRSSFGTLVLVGPSFGEEERLTANSLASHAVVALENARLHEIVEQQALVDGLTGLANRRHCEESLSAELARAERLNTPLTAIFADLDDFKKVNDAYGHPAGDVVLREFALVLADSVREADVAGRWGGEEFLLLLPGTDAAGGVRLAERIRRLLEERVILGPDGVQIRLTCSFGVACCPPVCEAPALLGAADEALYRAKRAGKNRVATVVPSPEARARP